MYLNKILAAGLLVLGSSYGWADTTPQGGVVSLGTTTATSELSDLRGGTSFTFNDQDVHGKVNDNKAFGVQTGTNTITQGAFGNVSGLPIVVQNTGANVLIQNAVILNVQMQ
jgi:hypothetical protein